MKIIVTILILYLLYKLIFDFIVPVVKTTAQVKSRVTKMQQMQEDQLHRQKQPGRAPHSNNASPVKDTTTTDGEYIDFEDVK
ncbi:MAG: hypothetical protein ABI861_02735 [Panacibacter sp.]